MEETVRQTCSWIEAPENDPTDLNTDSRVEGEKGIGTLTAQADASKLDAEAKGKAVNIGASTSRKNDTDVEEEDVDGVFSSYP